MSLITPQIPPNFESGPAWEIARLFPNQGEWDEGDYLALNRMTNGLVELVDGSVEVLEMPTKSHQRRMLYLRDALKAYCEAKGAGDVLVSPYPVKVAGRRFREPDVVYAADAARLGEDYGENVDLVMEIVSKDRDRDLVHKRRDYAEAGIREYWIVDPEERVVIVLGLKGRAYESAGEFREGQTAKSTFLAGFEVDVAALFAQV